jgi:hypothetical protein
VRVTERASVADAPTEVLPPLPPVPEPEIVARTKRVPSQVPDVSASTPVAAASASAIEVAPRQEIVVPPPPVPPMPPVDGPAPDDGSRRSRKAVIIASLAVALLAIGGGVAALLLSGSEEPRQAAELLRNARDRTTVVMRRANDAEKLGQLNVVGGLAERTSDELGAIQDQLEAFEDRRIGVPAAAQVQAEKRYLDRLESLQRIDRKQLARWEGIKDRVIEASRGLRDAGEPVDALKLESTVPLTIDVKDLTKTTEEIDDVISTGRSRLRSYTRRVAEWRAAQRRAVQPVDSYRASVNAVLSAYAVSRSKTDRFIDSADTRGKMDVARSSLQDQIAAREELLRQLGSLTVPAGVSSGHDGIVSVISDSIDALGYGISATYEYEDNPGTLPEQSSWSSFLDASRAVGARREAAIARWSSAVGVARNRARDAARTPQPPIPDL